MSGDTLHARLSQTVLNVSGGLFFEQRLAEGEARVARNHGHDAEVVMVASRGAVLLWLVVIAEKIPSQKM